MSSDSDHNTKPVKRRRHNEFDSDSSSTSSSSGSNITVPHRKRRSHGNIIVESSDDDSEVFRPQIRRRNTRLVSEDESSSSTDAEMLDGNTIIDGSSASEGEWESDWVSEVESEREHRDHTHNSGKKKSPKKSVKTLSKLFSDSDTDQSDGQSEKCPICLLSFKRQEIGNPSTCDHCFCFECIVEWSKNVNTCPVDRTTFTEINVKDSCNGKVIRQVPVELKTQADVTIQEDPTYCECCHLCDREDRMLLCDGCDLGYHLECLDPPMEEVPGDEFWFCPECSLMSNQDAEEVDIDLDEVPHILEEARRLGLSYGRTRSGIPSEHGTPRMIPRTRQSERVRANIRAGRDRNRASRDARSRDRGMRRARRSPPIPARVFDLEQPSTSSSGLDTRSETSRGRSSVPSTSSVPSVRRLRRATTSRTGTKRKSKKRRKSRKTTTGRVARTEYREVRITEYDEDGEEVEIVSRVKVKVNGGPKRRTKRRKKRKGRRARTVASVAAAKKTVKRRLANALGIVRPRSGVRQLVPSMKNSTSIAESAQYKISKQFAGIGSLSLFGGNLDLNYSPPGSDDEYDAAGGPTVQVRPRTALSSIRRRAALKGIVEPATNISQPDALNLIDNIMQCQEMWHSKKSKVSLTSDGTLHIDKPPERKPKPENNNNNNVENGPIRKPETVTKDEANKPLDLSKVNSNDMTTRAPMYNSPRSGGGNRGNFRGGFRESNNRHSHGGGGNAGGGSGGGGSGGGGGQNYGGGQGFSGRHSYGGSGNSDYGGNYGQHFEHRGPAPPSNFGGGNPPFRNWNPQQFRGRFPAERPPFAGSAFPRMRMPGPGGNQVPPPPPPLSLRPRMATNAPPFGNFRTEQPSADSARNVETRQADTHLSEAEAEQQMDSKDDEECDIYCDIEGPGNKGDESRAREDHDSDDNIKILPPPDPPTGLIDYDENSKSERDNDSDQEDLVIDDNPKDEPSKDSKPDDMSEDKYDPFADNSDSNDSVHKASKNKETSENDEAATLEPPPSLLKFPGMSPTHSEISPLEPPPALLHFPDMSEAGSPPGTPAPMELPPAMMQLSEMSMAGSPEAPKTTRPLEPPPSLMNFPGLHDENSRESTATMDPPMEPPPSLLNFPDLAHKTSARSEAKISDPLEPPPSFFDFPGLTLSPKENKKKKDKQDKKAISVPRIRLTAYDDDDEEDSDSQSDCPNFSIYSSETMDVARHTEQELSSQIGPLEPPPAPPTPITRLESPPPIPKFDSMDSPPPMMAMGPLEPPPMMEIGPLEPPPMMEMGPLEPPPMMDIGPLEPPPPPPTPITRLQTPPPMEEVVPLEPPPPPPTPISRLQSPPHTDLLEPPPPPPTPITRMESPIPIVEMVPLEPPPPPPAPMPSVESSDQAEETDKIEPKSPSSNSKPLESPPTAPLELLEPPPTPPSFVETEETEMTRSPSPLEPPPLPPDMLDDQEDEEELSEEPQSPPMIGPVAPLAPPPLPPGMDTDEDDEGSGMDSDIDESSLFEPPPEPPSLTAPEDDDVIVGDVEACDLSEIQDPADGYVESIRKQRQNLNKIPAAKKILQDTRGKIIFKIGNKTRLNNKISLYDEIDENFDLSSQDRDKDKDKDKERDKESEKKETGKKHSSSEKTEGHKRRDRNESPRRRSKTSDSPKRKSESSRKRSDTSRRRTSESHKSKTKQSDSSKMDSPKPEIAKLKASAKGKIIDSPKESSKDDFLEGKEEKQDTPAVSGWREVKINESQKVKFSPVSVHPDKDSDTAPIDLESQDIKHDDDDDDEEIQAAKKKVVVETENESDSELSATKIIDITQDEVSVSMVSQRGDAIERLDSSFSITKMKELDHPIYIPSDDEEEERGATPKHSRFPVERLIGDKMLGDNLSEKSMECESISSQRRASEGEDKEEEPLQRSKVLELDISGAFTEKISFRAEIASDNFPMLKEASTRQGRSTDDAAWESDGAYTPCKDELPMKSVIRRKMSSPIVISGLEPITPTREKINDDMNRCRTPAGYAGLGTEAISETDEAMNFEDELALLNMRKDKDMEEGEIPEERPKKQRAKSRDKEDEGKRKKKKKDKSKEVERNKENMSENLVSWKKVSKSNKDRQYREKRSKSRDKEAKKKKIKEVAKKKEKRKELPRYDVRKLIAEKTRLRKDEYGRDIRHISISKSRSLSRRSRSYSRMRSRSKSPKTLRRSWSRPRRSRSLRSLTPRRLSPPRRQRLKSPRRRSLSRRRSFSRRRSRSRSLSRRRRSLTPRRRLRAMSVTRKHRSRSHSRDRDRRKEKKKYRSASRPRTRKRSLSKTPKSRSRDKKHSKRKALSRSRERSLSRERNRNWEHQMADKVIEREQHFIRDRERESWSAQWTPSWSRSRSKTPPMMRPENMARNWSPPPVHDNLLVPPKNLTVILTNKEAIKKKKKKERKEMKKAKEAEKRKKNKRIRTPPPQKEVFASGDNILVSVCFNKENEIAQTGLPELPETIPLLPPVKRRRREPLQIDQPLAKKSKKDKAKDKRMRSKSPKPKKDKKKKSKAAEIAASKKPVAVIDLDQSPFREQTPSPRDIIVLSDDEDKQQQEMIATPDQQPSPQATPQHDPFLISQGPKTPPEPQVKFSINKQTNILRPSLLNPLLEEEEEMEMEMEEEVEVDERAEEELEMRAQEELELRLKVGPNTPPEPPSSPPTSPDAYDPFDPTKSRSPTPVASQDDMPITEDRERNLRSSPRKHDSADVENGSGESDKQETPVIEKVLEKPKIISMVTIKKPEVKRDTSPIHIDKQAEATQTVDESPKLQSTQQVVQTTTNTLITTINPVLAAVAATVQRSTIFNTSTPVSNQRNLLQANRISPSSQMKRPTLPNLFATSAKPMPLRTTKISMQNKNISMMVQNGSDATIEVTNDGIDMSSPYSPGSTLSDGLFDPPSPAANWSPIPPGYKPPPSKKDRKDVFDTLFDSSPIVQKGNKGKYKKVEKDKRKKSTNAKVGVRMDENQLQILDDLPSSAVEMQVKDKFLKKLNRQERVVEEVKLVLKPHYTKKHVTKEEYKDIMRKAVPKICHNRSGEINPKKIAALIEAYVKKARCSKRKASGGAPGAAVKKPPVKTLWS